MYIAASETDQVSWQAPRKSVRPLLSVPPLIENLWEWKRPEGFPSLRLSTFTSPTIDLALRRAEDPACTRVYRVAVPMNARMAKFVGPDGTDPDNTTISLHPDVSRLPALLLTSLGPGWAGQGLRGKARPGLLWIPCLSKEEVEMLFRNLPVLARIRASLWDAVTFWDDVCLVNAADRMPDSRGELFFECADGYWREIVRLGEAQPAQKAGLFGRFLPDFQPASAHAGH